MLRITLRKSPIGFDKTQKATVKALGLGKLNSSTLKPDVPQIRGMIRKVVHLVEVERIDGNVEQGGSGIEAE